MSNEARNTNMKEKTMNNELRLKIQSKITIEDDGCHIFKIRKGSKVTHPSAFIPKKDGTYKRYNVLREIWMDKYGTRKAPGTIHRSCTNNMCVNPDHIQLSGWLESRTTVNEAGEWVLNDGVDIALALRHRAQAWSKINNREPERTLRRKTHNKRDFNPKNCTDNIQEALRAKVRGNDGQESCWIWSGYRLPTGYGCMSITLDNGKVEKYAHRVTYITFKGPIPEDMHVCHTCDSGHLGCVNPDHLILGTSDQNMQDGVDRNRFIGPKLTLEERADVYALRNDGLKPYDVALKYNVTGQTILQIWNGVTSLESRGCQREVIK